MNKPQTLGERKRATVEQDEQGTVILRGTDVSAAFSLSPDEALDLLQWLFEHQDGLILSTPTGKLDSKAQEKESS
jgi:hypothetical protein